MKYYFFSPVEGVLTRGGSFLGKINKNVAAVYPDDNAVYEIRIPGMVPCVVSRVFSENVWVKDYYYGKLFIPEFKKTPFAFKEISEKRTVAFGHEVVVRLYRDGQTKVDVFFYNDKLTAAVPIDAEELNLINCGNSVLIELKKGVKHVILISLASHKVIYSATCVSYEIKDVLVINKLIVGTCEYIHTEHLKITDEATPIGKSLRVIKPCGSRSELTAIMRFFELIKYDGDYESYLSPSLIGKADAIRGFLGNYDYVLPPVESDFPKKFTLISKNDVKYVDVTLENDKICDIDYEFYPKTNI